jgi:regulator of replication initiation timing
MRSHPRFETSLRTAIVKLKDTIANKNKEFKQLRVDVPALVRAVNQLTLGNQQLRERLQRPTSDVIPFPNRQSPHPNG